MMGAGKTVAGRVLSRCALGVGTIGNRMVPLSTQEAESIAGGLGRVKDAIDVAGMKQRIASWTVDENETVFNATRRMVDHNTGCLCVTRDEKVVGIVTERDYLRKVLHAGRTSKETKVKDIATMEDKLLVASPEADLQDCIDDMVYKRIRHIPIAQDGEVLALLGIEDVARALSDERQVTLHCLEDILTAKHMPIHDG